MVTVKLTEGSRLGVRYIFEGLEGRTEITQNDSTSVSLRRAIIALSDDNLMFEFDESDREGLLNLPEKLLDIAFREIGRKESGTSQDLCDILLPKKATSKPKSKPKPKKTSTTAKKSALSED